MNSVKHAAARRINIRLAMDGPKLTFSSLMMELDFRTSCRNPKDSVFG